MKRVPIETAREIGGKAGADRVVVIAIGSDSYCVTTWGKTRRECQALGDWADSPAAERVVLDLAATPPPH